jgi:hypothetical protein
MLLIGLGFCVVLCFVCLRPVSYVPVFLDCPFLFYPSVFSNVSFRLVYPMLPVSLDCPFLFYPSVFSNVSFRLVYPMLPVFLDCSFLIAPSVFYNVSFRLVSCIPYSASVSGLSILVLPFGILERVFSHCVLYTLCCQFLWIVHSCFTLRYSLMCLFALCLIYPMLPVSLDCPFLFYPSVFSNVSFRLVYPMLPMFLDCPFLFTIRYSLMCLFALCLIYHMLPVFLDCPFLLYPSVFSNVSFRLVYPMLLVSLDCSFLFHPLVFSNVSFRLVYPMLPVSLDCPFLIAPSVFYNVSFRLVSCIPYAASVSGLSILVLPFGIL